MSPLAAVKDNIKVVRQPVILCLKVSIDVSMSRAQKKGAASSLQV